MLEKSYSKGVLNLSDVIIVALLALLGNFFGVIASAHLTNYRLKQLENKVDKHNNFAEKIPLLDLRIKELEHRETI